MDGYKRYALIAIALAILMAIATLPGVWNYTETNEFCGDCHKEMGFSNEKALSSGLAEYHYEEAFHGHEKDIACEECHKGEGISGMIDVKVIQASHEVYQYFALGNRKIPHKGSYPDEYCTKPGCHPNATQNHDEKDIDTRDKNCISCHSGHNNIHESAKKAALTSTLNCMNCHSRGLNETHINYNATQQNCTECHDQEFTGNMTEQVCSNCHSNSAKSNRFSKHQTVDCTECHSTHQEIPSCSESGCHEEIHEEEFTECGECHTGAHEARQIKVSEQEQCLACHEEEESIEKIQTEGDAHKQINCTECHNGDKQHGDIPTCSQSDCHEEPPHGPEKTECYSCHDEGAHNPLPVETEAVENNCSDCHEEAVQTIEESGSSHSEINCSLCHTSDTNKTHGFKRGCDYCHKEPHNGEFTEKECDNCHTGGAHNPLEMDLAKGHENFTDCAKCHGSHPYDTEITDDMCIDCHEEQRFVKGTSHGTLNCTECHTNEQTIVNCEECHEEPHNGISMECESCHENGGHNPGGSVQTFMTRDCNNCHTVEFKGDFKIHNKRLVCTTCHENHFESPSCIECHEYAHPSKDLEDQCKNCHGTMVDTST